jgi:hypothetical protein
LNTFTYCSSGGTYFCAKGGSYLNANQHLDPQHTESTLLTVESDALHGTLQPFNRCIPVRRVIGTGYHLLQSRSLFCEAALFVLLATATGTGIIAAHLLTRTEKGRMQACTVGPAKTAEQFIV